MIRTTCRIDTSLKRSFFRWNLETLGPTSECSSRCLDPGVIEGEPVVSSAVADETTGFWL